jgi:peptidoglycan/LPS O-acetylase OafA/YrhL
MYITEEDLLRKNNNFDVLRLTAALFVFISHTYGIRDLGNYELLSRLTANRYVFSTLGLAIFFSMSGFLVCRSLVTATSIKQYLLNRFLRIWPAYATCTLLCVLFIGLLFTTLPVLKFITHPQTLSYFFINISLLSSSFFLPGVFNNKAINPSIWTIPIEVRLYLLLLFVHLIAKFRFRQWLLLILVSIWIARLFMPTTVQFTFIKPHILHSINLAIYFLTGACFYLYKEKIAFTLYIWLVLFAYWLALHLWFPTYVEGAEHPFMVYSFMWVAMRWYTLPFIKADISYGFYLFAAPIQKVIQYTIGEYLSFIEFLLITGACTVVVATLSWYLIEKKALSLKYLLKRKQVPTTT